MNTSTKTPALANISNELRLLDTEALTAEDARWCDEADQALLEANPEGWEQWVLLQGMEALVRGQFRKASFYFDDYVPSRHVQQALAAGRAESHADAYGWEDSGCGEESALQALWAISMDEYLLDSNRKLIQ
jgi:hypothetical protein